MNIGSGIKEVREKLGLTQMKVCEKTGLTQGFYSSVETGTNKPSLSTLEKISSALGVPVFVIIWLSTEVKDVPKQSKSWYATYYDDIKKIIDQIK